MLDIGKARRPAPEDHDDLVTATEAVELFDGLYERKLYAWVRAGLVKARRTRFTAYTLYSVSEIRAVINSKVDSAYIEAA